MKKQENIETASRIPESYWKTESGQKLASVMHADGWEVSDCLESVISTLDEAVAAAAKPTIAAELAKARNLMAKAKETYWQAAALLKDSCF